MSDISDNRLIVVIMILMIPAMFVGAFVTFMVQTYFDKETEIARLQCIQTLTEADADSSQCSSSIAFEEMKLTEQYRLECIKVAINSKVDPAQCSKR